MVPTNKYTYGWFGIPGGPESRSTLVHIVDDNDKPICGSRLSRLMKFQWCGGMDLTRPVFQFGTGNIECKRCLAAARKVSNDGRSG